MPDPDQHPRRAASDALRLSGAYLLLFAALGLYLPYFPVYLQAQGFDGAAIGWMLALAPLMRFVAPPVFGALADRVRGPRFWSMCAAWGSVAGMALVAVGPGPALAVGLLLYFLAAAPAIPLLDATALHLLDYRRARFGRMRTWGSAGFAAASLGLGLAFPEMPAGVVIMSLVAAHFAFALYVSLWRLEQAPPARPPLRDIPALLADRRLLLVLLVLVLNRVASGPFNGFYTIFVKEAGHGGEVVAWTWGIAVAVEVFVMLAVDRAIDRYGAFPVLAFGGLLEAARWFAYAARTDAAALLLLAPLHGIAFATTYVAMVRGVADMVPRRHRSTGQGVAAAATALGQGLGFVGAGYLYDAAGASAMFAVAGVVGLASLIALAPLLAGRGGSVVR